MAGTRWTDKRRALVIATFTLVCVAFLRMAATYADVEFGAG
jgi:hypothetical protein